MNVALFHDLPAGGGAMRVIAEYVAHSTAGHRFTVYTPRPVPASLGALSDLETRAFPRAAPRSPAGRLAQLARLPRDARRLAAEIDAGGADVVFCHRSDLTQAPEVLPYLRTPSLYYAPETLRTQYEPPPEFGNEPSVAERLARSGLHPYERLRRSLDRRFIRGADTIVTHSAFTARSLREAYAVEAEVVPLGVDAATFTPGPAERDGTVLSVGALHPWKGHEFVIEALGTLPSPRPPLVVVGDRGALDRPLRELAAARGVSLDLRRAIPFSELTELYRHASAVACGQVREPFGLIALEAMACATPVVAVREGGLAETVSDGRTGLLTERDPTAFGAAIARVLGDRDLARTLGAAGREAAVTDWTWERTAQGFDALLARLAPGPR